MEFGRRARPPAGLCVASIIPPPRSVGPHRHQQQRPRQDASSSPPAFFSPSYPSAPALRLRPIPSSRPRHFDVIAAAATGGRFLLDCLPR